MTRDVVLGVDCSTTSAKCIAWGGDGVALAEGRAPIGLRNPGPGAYEQDAEQWWSSTAAAVKQCAARLRDEHSGARVVGISVAHQRETFVIAERSGRPLCPALVWMDERARAEVAEVSARAHVQAIHDETGKPVCLTPSVYKWLWLRGQSPERFSGDFIFADVHAFLVHRLTGRWVTATASADPTGLVSLHTGDWSERMLGLAGLSRDQLPALVAPGERLGALSAQAASSCGLPSGIPIFAGAGDGQAAGLGAGVDRPGVAYLNLGTAVVSGVWSASALMSPAFRTLFGAAPGSFFLETDLKGGTFMLNWLTERFLGVADRHAAIEALWEEAAILPPGAEGLMLVPYWCGVMNPWWDDDAAGAVIGWRGHHGQGHLFRAMVEGIAFEQRLHAEGVVEATGAPLEAFVAMGGGARSALWRQIIADVTGVPVRLANTEEATSLGAGVLAAVGAGLHSELSAAVRAMTGDLSLASGQGEVTRPGVHAATYDRLYREVYTSIFPGVRGAMQRLTTLTATAEAPSQERSPMASVKEG